jgi:5-(aminomethyl)-3-furanmethanol phosphate kinase
LQCVLAQRANSHPLLIIGGGATADLVRQWDAVHRLGEETSHWLAIRAMVLNERLVESIVADSVVVRDRAEAETAWQSGRVPVLCCFEFLRTEEQSIPEEARLPCAWNATSDSIAAWIARHWPAEELVLVKSCDLSAATDCAVDPLFVTVAAGLPRIGWVNLRDDAPVICDGALDTFSRDSEALRRGARRADSECPPRSSPKTPSRG